MNKSKPLIILFSIGLLLVLIAWLAGAFHDKIPAQNQPVVTETKPDNRLALVPQKQPLMERLAATVSSKQATYISARILAPIEKINVRAGDEVSQGQVLIELDKRQLMAKLQQAKQGVAAVKAQLTDAEQNYQRIAKLYRDKVVSKADMDRVSNQRDSLRAEQQRAEKALEEAETALSYARIKAPIRGKVVDRFMEPGDTAAPGQHILSLYNPGSMRVEAHVREGLALSLVTGQNLTAYIPAVNQQVTVSLEEIVPAADPGARTFLVKAALPGELGVFPGMYAELQLPAGETEKLYVPVGAVTTVGQQRYVEIWNGQQVQRRFVRLGRQYPELGFEVISGLAAGDELVLGQ